jgi:AcrR family transcriptional regulator
MEPNKRPALTRRTVIESGLKLLDEVGLDGLTVRRLAAELGVQSPDLYWHFRTKQELLDGMADAIIVAAGMGPPDDGESWQEWLMRRAHDYRRSLLAHRDGARIVVHASALAPSTVETFDAELAAMVERGFTPVEALRTISAITYYVNGFVLQEQTERPAGPPFEVPPTLLEAISAGGSPASPEAFEYGLRALLRGTVQSNRSFPD